MVSQSEQPTLFYVHDPMCSWCWGFQPTWQAIQAGLPKEVRVRYLVGGLASDTDQPMPVALQQQLQSTWQRIEQLLGTQFNHAFWQLNTPKRATYQSCRAVLAAEDLAGKGRAMIAAIQQGYYLQARNPSELPVLVAMASELGIDARAFRQWFDAPDNERAFQEELAFARSLPIAGFPSLVLSIQGQNQAIELDYQHPQVVLDAIDRQRSMVGTLYRKTHQPD